jgi:asparagine synthase (glutamine-hydrolysing)
MVHPLRQAASGDSRWHLALRALRRGATAPNGADLPQVLGAAQRRRNQFVEPQSLMAVFPELPPLPEDFDLFEFDGTGVDDFARWIRFNEYTGHLGRVLQKVDRASMHVSLEVRVPLLDREVVEVASRVDWRSSVDLERGTGKLPLRAALEKRLGFQTPGKRGFDVPMASWLSGPLRPLLESLVLSRVEILGLPIDRIALRRIFRRHVLRLERADWLLWRLLSLSLWEARHLRPVRAHV